MQIKMGVGLIIHINKENQGSYHQSDGLVLVPHLISVASQDII